MSTSPISTAAADQVEGTPITSLPPDIIKSHILNRLDGSTLTSTSCTSPELHSLSTEDQLWRDICNSTWPSTAHHRVRNAISTFPAAHRSFYADAFPSIHHNSLRRYSSNKTHILDTSELISAVDIFYDDELIYSKVLETETLSGWFLSSPFRLELLDPKELIPMPFVFDKERLRVSWILIDPATARNRAVNVASQKAELQFGSLSDDIQLGYGTVVEDGGGELVRCGVVVTLGGEEGGEMNVKEVNLQVEDMEGNILSGMDSLVIFSMAMEGQRRRKSDNVVEKDIFEKFNEKKTRVERKQRKATTLDVMMRIAVCVSIFFAILMVVCWR